MHKSAIASAIILGMLSVSHPAQAEPQGGQVRSGSATIQQTSGSTTIRQLTDRAIIDWQKFSIDRNELVKFVQPNEMAVILNRVTGGDPSIILGKLQANGQLFLVNPNGILFGPGSQVDVGSLVATTLSLSDQDFLNGNYHFVQDSGFDLKSVINQGEIHVTDEGYVILTAPLVSNEGLIVANLGHVALGAGDDVTLNLDGRNLVNFQVGNAGAQGTVVLTRDAVSNVLQQAVGGHSASELVEENGTIRLVGGSGTLVQAGTIQAGDVSTDSSQLTVLTGQTSATSSARILGQNVTVAGNVQGQTVLVGGNQRGQGPEHRATSTRVESGATVTAEDGGTLVVWADHDATVAGTLVAHAGNVEMSAEWLTYTGAVDFPGGTLLIDPHDVNIVKGGDPTGPNDFTNLQIETMLGLGSVTIDATTGSGGVGQITQNADAPISVSLAANRNLTLTSGATAGIALNGDITASGTGALTVDLTAGTGDIVQGGAITTNGGDFTTSGGGKFTQSGTLTAGAGSIALDHTGAVEVNDLSAASITIDTGANIVELVSDPEADLTATTLDLQSVSGVGSPGRLQVEADDLSATVSSSGSIGIDDLSGGLNVLTATTPLGGVSLSATGGDLTLVDVSNGTIFPLDASTYQSGDIVVGLVSGPTVLLTSAGAIREGTVDGASDVLASTRLFLTAPGGIGQVGTQLQVDTPWADVLVEGAGAGVDLDFASVPTTLKVTVNGGPVEMLSGLTGVLAYAPGGAFSAPTTLGSLTFTTYTGNLVLDEVHAGTVKLETRAGSISNDPGNLSTDITATSSIELAASTGIDVSVSGASLTTRTSGVSAATALELDSVFSIFDLSTNRGTITLSGADTLTYGPSGLSGAVQGGQFTLSELGSNLLVDSLTVASGLGQIHLDSTFRIEELGNDPGNDLFGQSVNLTANDGIGTQGALEVSVLNTVIANTTGGDIALNVDARGNTVYHAAGSGGSIVFAQTGGYEMLAQGMNTTGTGDIDLSNDGANLVLQGVSAQGTGSVSATTTTSGDVVADSVLALNGMVSLDSVGEIRGQGGGPKVRATTLAMQAVTGIAAFDIQVANVSAAVSGVGDLAVNDVDGNLNVTSATTYDGTIALDTVVGTLQLGTVTVGGTHDLTLGNTNLVGVTLGDVSASGNVTVTSGGSIEENGDDPGADITGASIDLTAFQAIGAAGPLETSTTDLDLVISGPPTGAIAVANVAGDLTVTASIPNGDISLLSSGGDLNVTSLSQGQFQLYDLTLAAAGDITLGTLTAVPDAVFISAGGSLSQPGSGLVLKAASVTLEAGTGIGGASDVLEFQTGQLEAATTGGDIYLTNAYFSDPTVSLVVTGAAGDIHFSENDRPVTIADVSTFAGDATLTLGNVVLTDGQVNGTLTVQATEIRVAHIGGTTVDLTVTNRIDEIVGFEDAAADIEGSVVHLTAPLGIGGLAVPELSAQTITAGSANAGINLVNSSNSLTGVTLNAAVGIAFEQQGGGAVVVSADAGDGAVTLVSNGDLSADVVHANGTLRDVRITTSVGASISVDDVRATDEIVLSSDGFLLEYQPDGNVDLTAPHVSLAAVAGIGNGDALELDTPDVVGASTSVGGIDLSSFPGAAAVTVASLTAGSGNIRFVQGGSKVLNVTLADADNGSVSLQNTGATLNVDNAEATGDVTLAGFTANIAVNRAKAGANLIIGAASGSVEELNPDAQVDLIAPFMDIQAQRIGEANRLELAGQQLLLNASLGKIDVSNTSATAASVTTLNAATDLSFTQNGGGSLGFSNVDTTNGSITLSNAGAMSVFDLVLGGTGKLLTLTTFGGGHDLFLASVNAGNNNANLSSAGKIEEVSVDAGVDLVGRTLTLTTQRGIGNADALEIQSAFPLTATATGMGAIRLSNTGMLDASTVTTADGSISLTTDGFLEAGTITAGGTGRTLSLISTGDSVRMGTLTGTGAYVIKAAQNITTSISRPIDLAGSSIYLEAGSFLESLGVQTPSVTALSPGGNVSITNSALVDSTAVLTAGNIASYTQTGGKKATVTATSGSNLGISNDATVEAVEVEALGAGHDVTITTTNGGNVLAGRVVAAGDRVTINSGGALNELGSDPGVDIGAADIQLTSASDIGGAAAIEINATTGLQANITGNGVLFLYDLAGGLTASNVATANGSILLTANGNLDAVSVTPGGTGSAVLSTVGSGDVTLGFVNGDDVTVTSVGAINSSGAGALPENTLTLIAATGIGTTAPFQSFAHTLNAQVTGAGKLDLRNDNGALDATASTVNGDIKIANFGGALTARLVNAQGAGRDVVLSSEYGMLVDSVTAADRLTLTAPSLEELTPDATADLVGAVLSLTSDYGIGAASAIETDVGVLSSATVAGGGRISLRDLSGGLNVVSASTFSGGIAIIAEGGTLTARSVLAGGAGNTTLTAPGGSVLVDDVRANAVAISASGAIEEVTPDSAIDVTGSTLRLTAGTGIGAADRLEVNGTALTPVVTGVGGVNVADLSGGVAVQGASTFDGAIQLLAVGGDLQVNDLVAGGAGRNVLLTSSTDRVTVDSAAALDDTITVTAATSIGEQGSDPEADLSALNLVLNSQSGVGNADRIEVKTANLTASAAASGRVAVEDLTATLTVLSANAPAGQVDLAANGTLTLSSVVGTSVFASSATKIVVDSVTSSGSVNLTAGTSIEENGDPGVDIVAPSSQLTMNAVTGIGATDALETDVSIWVAHATGIGAIRLTDVAGSTISADDVDTHQGEIVLVARNQTMFAKDVQAGGAGSFVNLVTQTSGELSVGLVSAPGAVNLTSAGDITQFAFDPDPDVVAGAPSVFKGNTIGVGGPGIMDVQITNATLSVLATGQSGGLSVRINGTVSPTNTLIKLNSPPGSVLFNGVVVP